MPERRRDKGVKRNKKAQRKYSPFENILLTFAAIHAETNRINDNLRNHDWSSLINKLDVLEACQTP